MVYRVMGIMSGSSLDGLDIVCVQLEEQQRKWQMEVLAAECMPFEGDWADRLQRATELSAKDHALLDANFGHYIGRQANAFIAKNDLHYKIALISSHGHTSFHLPPHATVQLGHGAAIAAETGLPVVTDLRAVDVALGGQGAPIVPMGEKLLWSSFPMLLNIGGIANLSVRLGDQYLAYDVCPANRVLNMLALKTGKSYDEGGKMAASGSILPDLLMTLNELPYYGQPYPKSLANDFGTDVVFPKLEGGGWKLEYLQRTYVEHIAVQVAKAVEQHAHHLDGQPVMMITGGGAFNDFLVGRIRSLLEPMRVSVEVPDADIVNYKEAIIMALLGVLRWREEPTVMASVTGASRDSVGGAVWRSQV